MGKHNGTGIMESPDCNGGNRSMLPFRFPSITNSRIPASGPALTNAPMAWPWNLRRMGLPGVAQWSKDRPKYLFRFPPGRSFHSGSENFHPSARVAFAGGKESSVKVTVLVNWLSGKLFVLGLLGHLAGPCLVEHLGVHIGAKAVSRFLGMGTPEFLPGEGTLLNLVGEFAGEVNSGDPVFFEHALMGGHGQRSLSLFELLEHALVDEMSHDDIGLGALHVASWRMSPSIPRMHASLECPASWSSLTANSMKNKSMGPCSRTSRRRRKAPVVEQVEEMPALMNSNLVVGNLSSSHFDTIGR